MGKVKTMDWIGAAINLIGWYIMPKNRLIATCIFLVSNMLWISWGIGHTTWSIVIVEVCFFYLNIRAVLIWKSPIFLFIWYVIKSCEICWGVFVAILLSYIDQFCRINLRHGMITVFQEDHFSRYKWLYQPEASQSERDWLNNHPPDKFFAEQAGKPV